jgi:hypothetical protein
MKLTVIVIASAVFAVVLMTSAVVLYAGGPDAGEAQPPAPPADNPPAPKDEKPDREAVVKALDKLVEKAPQLGPVFKDFTLALYDKDYAKAWGMINKASQESINKELAGTIADTQEQIKSLEKTLANADVPEDQKAAIQSQLDGRKAHLKELEALDGPKYFGKRSEEGVTGLFKYIVDEKLTFEKENVNGNYGFIRMRLEAETQILRFAREADAWKIDFADTLKNEIPGVTRDEVVAVLDGMDLKKAAQLGPAFKEFELALFDRDYKKAWGLLGKASQEECATQLKEEVIDLKGRLERLEEALKDENISEKDKADAQAEYDSVKARLAELGAMTPTDYRAVSWKQMGDWNGILENMKGFKVSEEKIDGDKGTLTFKREEIEEKMLYVREDGAWKRDEVGPSEKPPVPVEPGTEENGGSDKENPAAPSKPVEVGPDEEPAETVPAHP